MLGGQRLSRTVGFVLRRIGALRSPFRRPVDRVENAARLVAVLAIACAMPFALSAGAAMHRHDVASSAKDSRQVTAVTLNSVPPEIAYGAGPTTVPVPARWRAPDGTVRTGVVQVMPPERAGARLSIWIDAAGLVSTPPMSATALVMRQAVTVAVCLLGALLVVAGLLCAVHVRLDRVRYARWDRDWYRLAVERPDRLHEP
jgi:hypothetical protein